MLRTPHRPNDPSHNFAEAFHTIRRLDARVTSHVFCLGARPDPGDSSFFATSKTRGWWSERGAACRSRTQWVRGLGVTELRRNGAPLRTKFGEEPATLSLGRSRDEAEASEGRFLATELRACRWGRCRQEGRGFAPPVQRARKRGRVIRAAAFLGGRRADGAAWPGQFVFLALPLPRRVRERSRASPPTASGARDLVGGGSPGVADAPRGTHDRSLSC